MREALVSYGDVDIFAVGGDDLAAVLPDDLLGMQRINGLKEIFFETCGRTLFSVVVILMLGGWHGCPAADRSGGLSG